MGGAEETVFRPESSEFVQTALEGVDGVAIYTLTLVHTAIRRYQFRKQGPNLGS
jgi:hypothetical protein